MYLHSTMVLFKCCFVDDKDDANAIYIPLWSYSNYDISSERIVKFVFTFHYGPIQMLLGETSIQSLREFTFHYGPIQIDRAFD